jgi:hypothetical protein
MPKVFQLNYEDNFEIEKELLGNSENQVTDRGKNYLYILHYRFLLLFFQFI